MKMYRDKFRCPKCKARQIVMRRVTSAGKLVSTPCVTCKERSVVIAGPVTKEATK